MRELFCNTIAIRSIDRAFNVPANVSFQRLDIAFDGDTWPENESIILTLAGTIAFKGMLRARNFSLDDESAAYDAVDGLVYLVKNACPVVHEFYNRVKADPADAEPQNQTIHGIIQTEFATLVTTAAGRNFVVVNSLDTSAANSVIPGEVSPVDKTFIDFLNDLCGYQPALRYYLDYAASTAASPWPAGTLRLIDTADLSTEQLDLIVSQGKNRTDATTYYNVESLSIQYNADDCVDNMQMVGSQYFEYKELLTEAWTPTWTNITTEYVGWTLDSSWDGGQVTAWHPLQYGNVQSVVVIDAATPSITYAAPDDYTFAPITGYIMRTYPHCITISTTVCVSYQALHSDAYRRYRTSYDVAQFRLETYAGTVGIHPQPMTTWSRWYKTTATCPYAPLDRWQPNYDIPAANEDAPIVYFMEQQNFWESRANTAYPYTLRVPWSRDIRMQYTGRVDWTVTVTTGTTKWSAGRKMPARSFFQYSDIGSVVLWDDTTRLTRLGLAQLDAAKDPVVNGRALVTLPTSSNTWCAIFDLGKRVNVRSTSCSTWAAVNAVVSAVNYSEWDSGRVEVSFGRENDLASVIYPVPELNDIPERYLNLWPVVGPTVWMVTTPGFL